MTVRVFEVEPTPYPGPAQAVPGPDPELGRALDVVAPLLAGRRVWHVNATAAGGGVAELLVGFQRRHNQLGVDTGWLVADADQDFFAITKNLFFRLYSHPRAGDPLTAEHAAHYADVTAAHADLVCDHVRPGDVVVLHDPATLGLAARLRRHGVLPVWQSHLGSLTPTARQAEAWEFLAPHFDGPVEFVFTNPGYPPTALPRPAHVVLPAIDEYSTKNRPLDRAEVAAILVATGLVGAGPDAPETGGTGGTGGGPLPGRAAGQAEVRQLAPVPEDAQLLVQVSRWDETKDMLGVVRAFVELVAPVTPRPHLVLAGPDPTAIADDPGGVTVLDDVERYLSQAPEPLAARVHLVVLANGDREGTALVVNALQQAATVICQKSLCEGFGLTVTEGMWKARPVVASRVGGIPMQVVSGTNGLLTDPTDLRAFAEAVLGLLARPERARRLAAAGRDEVARRFLLGRQLVGYLACYASALAQPASPDGR